MRTEGQVRHKLKQVFYRHLSKRLAEGLAEVPENCMYNRRPSTHPRMTPLEDLPRVCIHAEQAGAICDRNHESSADYASCPFFVPVKSKEVLKREFVELARKKRDIVAEMMPDAAALMWVLEMEGGVPEGEAESAANGEAEGDEEEEPAPVVVRREKAPVFEMGEQGDVALVKFDLPPLDMIDRPTPRWWAFWRWRMWPWNWFRSGSEPLDCPIASPGADG